MNWDEYNILFHKLNLNRVAFKEVIDCSEEILTLVNAAIAAERKEWVGLTDEELLNAYGWYEKVEKNRFWADTNPMLEKARQDMLFGLRKVESLLREKNT